ncbi:MAG TPA: DNA repair protein RadC [Actinomycetota bacterium]
MTAGPRVRDYAPADRPRERLRTLGPSALSDAEVLSLILGTGGRDGVLSLAARVLAAVGGPGGLARASERELARVPGIGPAKAAEVVAALELGRRAARGLAAERPQIFHPADAAALLMPRLAHLDREESMVLVLDRRHRVLREASVGIGGVAHAPMEAREVLAAALREPGAAAVLVAHNHPSGEATPSPDDVAVTRRLARAAELVGLEFVDHLIVAARGWCSLVEAGALT